jgi:hypothetical protein
MHSTDDTAPARFRVGDVVMTVVLLVVFSGAYLLAQDWPFRAALFPKLLSVAGIGFAVVKLAGFAVQARRSARSDPLEPARPEPVEPARPEVGPAGPEVEPLRPEVEPAAAPVVDADDAERNEQSLEYVFGTAGARAWIGAVAWVTAFFLGLWLVGVYVIVPVFAFAYLRTAGKTSWPAAGVYAAVAGGVLWLAFTRLLAVPMPAGVF